MKGYAILSSPNDRFFEYPEYPCLELNPECAQWANAFLQTRLSPQLQTRIWRRLRHKKQFELWPAILLWLLQHNCNRAFQFLKLSFTHPYPPSFIAVDTLEYIAQDIEKQINRSQHKQTMAYRQRIAERIEDFLSTFLVYLQQGRRAFAETISQDLVQQVLKLSPDEGVKNLYLDLKTHGVKFDPRTVLAFTARFAELGEHEFGLETLGKAVELGHSPMEDGFIQLSSTVLRSSAMDGKSYHATSSIVARLLELGVCLDTQHYNIIILNAVEARDFQTAWHIYDLMESGDAGLEPDSYTLSILLRGLKHDENPAKHRDFANYCANRALKWKSNWLATEYLHYMYICYKGNGDETIRILRDEYRRFFDLQPLVDLKIFPPNFPSMPGCMTPFRPALFVMIASYLQFASSSLKDDEILSFYTNFRDLVHAGHPVIGPIVETVHTNCAFLLAFCDSPRLLKQAPMIIRDMSSALPKSAIYAAERRPLKMAAPSGITWNIFSHGFAKAGQMAAAEKVVELMRKRNIAPSEVTWATLLNGYARLQNVEKVAGMYSELSRTPEEFKTAGDPRRQAGITLTALGKVRDREQLVKALRWEMGGDAEGWGSVSSMLPPVGLKEFTGGGDSSSMDDEASPVGSKSD
jgi:pentatricopeptide repeat protein